MIKDKAVVYPVALQNMIEVIRGKNVEVPSTATLIEIPGYIEEITVDDFLKELDTPAAAEHIALDKEAYSDKGQKITGSLTIDPEILKAGETFLDVKGEYVGEIYLDEVEIETAPTKLTYEWGETFDVSGGEVAATYSNGATRTTDMNYFTPTRALTLEDDEVEVGLLEAGVAKTVAQAITVGKVVITTSASSITSPTGTVVITLNKAIPTLTEYDIMVEVDSISIDSFTLSDITTDEISIEFEAGAGLTDISVIEITITKENYTINDGQPIEVVNEIA